MVRKVHVRQTPASLLQVVKHIRKCCKNINEADSFHDWYTHEAGSSKGDVRSILFLHGSEFNGASSDDAIPYTTRKQQTTHRILKSDNERRDWLCQFSAANTEKYRHKQQQPLLGVDKMQSEKRIYAHLFSIFHEYLWHFT